MKKFITILCLLVFSIQLLPLRQVGSMLFSSQFTEEMPHSCNIEKATDLKFDTVKHDFFEELNFFSSSSQERYIHFTSSLPDNHEGEIQTPPPNFS